MKTITHNMRVQFTKNLGRHGNVQWMGTCFVMTAEEVALWPKEPKAIVNQDPGILSGDGTRETRQAAHDAELAKCVPLLDREHVMIDGKEYVAVYMGDFSDTFHFVPVKDVEVKYNGAGGKFHCYEVLVDGKVQETFGNIDAAYDYAKLHGYQTTPPSTEPLSEVSNSYGEAGDLR